MRNCSLMLVAFLLGCGGAVGDCRTAGVHNYVATREVATAGCESLPQTFNVSLTVESGTWTFKEVSGAQFRANYIDSADGCFGYADFFETATFFHSYRIWLNAQDKNYAEMVNAGGCMARYGLR
jgi:hypothetical protein